MRIWNRYLRMIVKPFFEIYRRLCPLKYARFMGVNFGENCHFYGPIDWGTEPWLINIGNNVYITNNCKFVNHDGGTLIFRKDIPDLEITKPITIGNDVYIGTDTFVMMGVNIGNNVVIGARSLITKDVPDNSVAAGHPARVIKTTTEYLEKLKMESIHLGHLKGKEKDDALREYYKYKK